MQITTTARENLSFAIGPLRRLHSRVLALRSYVRDLDTQALASAMENDHIQGGDGHVQNSIAGLMPMILGEWASRHSTAAHMLALLESSPDFAEACATFEPMIAAAAAEQAAEQTARQVIAEHEHAHRAAVEDAEARARDAIKDDAAVKAAAAALAKVQAK